ncbi:MAG: hypothetical protein E7426_01850 [Ruminococcaceae bacterium]|jgi:hypothetical protein|nr:hypothetical protein [Oscillospiraceae bacterium]
MNINWFTDEDNLIYINAEKDLHRLESQLRLPGLEEAATELHEHPTAEGLTLKGERRTTARLFIPDLLFGRHIEMGENIFLYRGDMAECYVIYWIRRD